jgi:C4-dicarboxylate transporter DctM subunit
MASALGIDPLHFAIIFIVNLEIGYLTPPVGLNLFVASTLFGKPVDYMIRSVLPFIGLMFIGLLIITYYPPLSGELGRWINGSPPWTWTPPVEGEGEVGEVGDDEEAEVGDTAEAPARPACDPPEDLNCDGNVTMEEITEFSSMGEEGEEAEEEDEEPARPACDPPEDLNCDGNVTMEEITEYSAGLE